MDHFTLTIPCKYYIGAYLENNCGIPADLSVFPELLIDFRKRLDKTPELHTPSSTIAEPSTVTIIIPNDDFYRYGYSMSKKNIHEFLYRIEKKLKFISRQYITLGIIMGNSMTSTIRSFQEEYCLSETVWAFETIKKDYDRNAQKSEFNRKSLKGEFCDNLVKENKEYYGRYQHSYKTF